MFKYLIQYGISSKLTCHIAGREEKFSFVGKLEKRVYHGKDIGRVEARDVGIT
jgi:hypothetical protein